MVRGDRRSEQKRREILRAARALFVTEGYADTGMEVVARHASVSTATLYAHFSSKAELFRTAVQEMISDIAADLARMSQPAETARIRLMGFARAYAAFCFNPMTRAVLLIVSAERRRFGDNVETLQNRTRREIGGALIGMLKDLAGRGELRLEKPAWAAGQLLGMIEHPTLVYGLVKGDQAEIERTPDAIAEEAVSTFLARYGVTDIAGSSSSPPQDG